MSNLADHPQVRRRLGTRAGIVSRLTADAIDLVALLLLAYLGYGWGLEGRTLGKTAMGLRVVRDDGSDLSPLRGVARAALYLLILPGILWAAFSGRNASLQDLVLGTSVVYDWGLAAPPWTDEPVR